MRGTKQMSLIKGFTRKQTELLTGLSRDKLAYLAREGIVIPEKFGDGVKASLVYSFAQLIQLRLIYKIRQHISLQVLKGLITFLQFDESDLKDRLMIIDDVCRWVSSDLSDLSQHIHIESGEFYSTKLIILPSIFELLEEMRLLAKDFDLDLFEGFVAKLLK